MWLITNFGFFSVVRKSENISNKTLNIRSRVKADLERLREKYLSGSGRTKTTRWNHIRRAEEQAKKTA
jgi:hypothetical protein